jgi:F-type H+-transporting ATPase subunit alpha
VLKQKRNSPVRVGCQVAIVYAVTNGYLNHVPVKDVKEYEQKLFAHLENKYNSLLVRFESNYFEDEDVELLKKALGELSR